MFPLNFFIFRGTAWRARLASFCRRGWVIFLHNWLVRLRNASGSSIRACKPLLRINIAAFINLRARPATAPHPLESRKANVPFEARRIQKIRPRIQRPGQIQRLPAQDGAVTGRRQQRPRHIACSACEQSSW